MFLIQLEPGKVDYIILDSTENSELSLCTECVIKMFKIKRKKIEIPNFVARWRPLYREKICKIAPKIALKYYANIITAIF